MNNETKIKILIEKLRKKIDINSSSFSWSASYSQGKRETNKRMYIKIKIDDGRIIFGKFPLNKNDKMVKKEANTLQKISITQFSISNVILKTNGGFFMSTIKGNPIEIILQKQGLSKSLKIVERAVVRIANFHQATVIHDIPFMERLNIYSKLIIGKSLHNLQEGYLFKEVSVGYMHGDLDPFNMFFDKGSNSYGLIDWEDFNERGFQELDILHFLMMVGVILYPRKDFTALYQDIFLKNTFLHNTIMKLLYKYCQIQKKNLEVIINLLPIYCDYQNYRLIKAVRNPNNFLYKTFEELFQEKGYKIYS